VVGLRESHRRAGSQLSPPMLEALIAHCIDLYFK
jgi:hypothetical protein